MARGATGVTIEKSVADPAAVRVAVHAANVRLKVAVSVAAMIGVMIGVMIAVTIAVTIAEIGSAAVNAASVENTANAGAAEIAMIAVSAEGAKNAASAESEASDADLVVRDGAGVQMIAVVIAGNPADRSALGTAKIGSRFVETGNGAERNSKERIVPCAAPTGATGRRSGCRAAKVWPI